MNILLTSAGRRTYMVDYFKKALDGKGLLFAANSQMSPALQKADGYFISPIIYSDEYIPFLLEKCKANAIGLIVSLFDIDIPVLAKHREAFEEIGTKLAVCDSKMLECCSDKLVMSKTLEAHAIGCPKTFTSVEKVLEEVSQGRLSWPVLIKPRFGMGSIGVLKAYDEPELRGAYSMCLRAVQSGYLKYESETAMDEAVLIQEWKTGSEYGLDIISDLDGHYVNTIIRKKYAMRSGETDEAIILGEGDDGYRELMETGRKLSELFHPRGLIDVDVIMDTEEKLPGVIDINARFGGGYPFSHIAGADVPRAYLAWAKESGEDVWKYCTAKAGVHGYKDITPKVYENVRTYE